MTPQARRFVCEIERFGLDENVEARAAVGEAWRMLVLARARCLDTTNAGNRSKSRHTTPKCINGLVHAGKCLTRSGPLWTVMLACCLSQCSDQDSANAGRESCFDVAPICQQWDGRWLASVRAFRRAGIRRPEDWLVQVPFRHYMRKPGPICGSASPQSEDRPSHKEIPIATD